MAKAQSASRWSVGVRGWSPVPDDPVPFVAVIGTNPSVLRLAVPDLIQCRHDAVVETPPRATRVEVLGLHLGDGVLGRGHEPDEAPVDRLRVRLAEGGGL